MRRWLYATRNVQGDPAVLDVRLRDDVADLLAEATDGRVHGPDPDGSQLLRLPGRVLGVDAGKTVRVRTGVASRRGDRTVIPVTWAPEPVRLAFPTFEGTIELSPTDRAGADLALVGSYAVPFGPLGAAADATALRTVAERTAEQLLEGLARALAARVLAGPRPAVVAPRDAAARLTVRDVMTEDPVVLVDDLPVRTAALLLFHLDVSGTPVVTGEGDLVGVLSERDLLEKEALPPPRLGRRGAEAERRREALTVGEACTRPAVTLAPDAPLRDAARTMASKGIGRLVVVEGSRIAGIVTRHDVLQALLRTDRDLQRAVDAVVDDLDDARVVVRWGVAHVDGRAPLRSSVAAVLDRIRAVDGIVAVEGDLGYVEDDIIPAMIGGPHF